MSICFTDYHCLTYYFKQYQSSMAFFLLSRLCYVGFFSGHLRKATHILYYMQGICNILQVDFGFFVNSENPACFYCNAGRDKL